MRLTKKKNPRRWKKQEQPGPELRALALKENLQKKKHSKQYKIVMAGTFLGQKFSEEGRSKKGLCNRRWVGEGIH